MSDLGRVAAALLLLLAAPGCASLVPVGAVLERMDDHDIDVVIDKAVRRYEQLGHVSTVEQFVLVIDSVVIGRSLQTDAERDLVRAIASYMLGEQAGSQWVTRVDGERAVLGDGDVLLLIYRLPEPRQFALDVHGSLSLFLPLARAGTSGPGGVEALSFDLRASNQLVAVAESGGVATINLELVPRSAVYSAAGPVFKRWSNALFQLSLGSGPDGATATAVPGTAAADESGRRRTESAVSGFLRNARPAIEPVARLSVRVVRFPDGTLGFAHDAPNDVTLILPGSLIAGDRSAEQALAQLQTQSPSYFARAGDDLLVRVGYFFFHGDATGPADPAGAARAALSKRLRMPPEGSR